MTMASHILCVGAAHWDMIARAGVSLSTGGDVPGGIERRLGGVALNIAKGLAERQHPVSLCSAVGCDDAGKMLIRDLEACGVACADILRIEGGATDHYVAIEDQDGHLFAAVADARLLDDVAGRIAQRATSALGGAGTVVLDANLAGDVLCEIANASVTHGVRIVANPVSPAKADRLTFLLSARFAPTLIVNLAEANVLLDTQYSTTLEAARALQARSKGAALVTDGGREVALVTADAEIRATPPEISDPVSVTGAGDALLAAFLAAPDREHNAQAALRLALEAAAEHMKAGAVT